MRSLLPLCLIALLPLPALAQGAKVEKLEPVKVVELKRPDAISYEKEIEPIFYKHCVACHSGKETRGKFDLGNYDALIKGGKRGPAILPGRSGVSLLAKLCGRTMEPYMPPLKEEDPLSPEELALI